MSKSRYTAELILSRIVRVPQMGPDATTSVYQSQQFTYGRGQQYPSSKTAVAELTKLVLEEFSHLCSTIEITIWNGCQGVIHPVLKTDKTFVTDFEGRTAAEFVFGEKS